MLDTRCVVTWAQQIHVYAHAQFIIPHSLRKSSRTRTHKSNSSASRKSLHFDICQWSEKLGRDYLWADREIFVCF